MTERAVLLPLGWPAAPEERELCTRLVLACKGSLERLIDEPRESFSAYLRHVGRLNLTRGPKETPLVVITSHSGSAIEACAVRDALREVLPEPERATWLVYVPTPVIGQFLDQVADYGGDVEYGPGLLTWLLHDVALIVVGAATQPSDLIDRLASIVVAPPRSHVAPARNSARPTSDEDTPPYPGFVAHAPSSQISRTGVETDPPSAKPSDPSLLGVSHRPTFPPNQRLRRS